MRSTRRAHHQLGRFYMTAILSGLAAGSCGRDAATEPKADLSDVVQWLHAIDLEENDRVINVFPFVSTDDAGRFLVVDPQEAQGRIYDPSGRLLGTFGGRGGGPGELDMPVAARHLDDGRIAVVGARGRLTIYPADPEGTVEAVQLPLMPVYGLRSLGGDRLLVAGRGTGGPLPPLLHIWNARTNEIERSFFDVPVDEQLAPLATSVGWVAMDMRGDTIAAAFALDDRILLFSTDGTPVRTITFPALQVRGAAVGSTPELDASSVMRWLEETTRVSDLSWLEDGSFLLQFTQQQGTDERFHLMHLGADGTVRFERRDTPRLLGTRGAEMYFVEPGSVAPNRWAVAQLR